MAEAELLLSARWLLPIAPENRVIDDGAIAIANGRITAVGQRQELLAQFPNAKHQHLAEHVLMPGLVNAHGHAAMTLLRGCGEDMPLMDWLNNRIWPLERSLVSPEFVQDGSLLACAEQIRSGITAFADNYFYPERIAKLIQQTGMRALLACPVLDFPMPGCADPKEAIAKTLKLHDDCRALPLVNVAFGPHAPYTVSDEWLTQISTYAEELGLLVHMHMHESAAEIEGSMQQYGMRPLQRLENLGALGPHFVAVHSVHINDDDLAILKRNNVQVVHCPESNLKLASGFAPVAKFLEHDIPVALGTDGAASNNDLDLFGELRSAAFIGKALAGSPTAMTAEAMLQMATLGGAKALGLEQEIGSLEIGKSADVIAVDLSNLNLQPIYNPIYTLVYGAHRDDVSDVWVAGQALLRNRDHLTIDTKALKIRIQQWQNRIMETLNEQR